MSDTAEVVLKPKFKVGDVIEKICDPRFVASACIGTILRCFWSTEQKQFIYLYESFAQSKDYGSVFYATEDSFRALTEVK